MTDATAPAPEPTASGTKTIPLATTLDEATLRQVFPGAPADLSVARDVKSMYSARLQRLRSEALVWVLTWAAVLVVGAVIGLAGSVVGWVLVGIAVVVAIGVLYWQYSKASADFFRGYATARGLQWTKDGHVSAGVPLFSHGDKRKFGQVMQGTIAAQPATLAHYTYTVVTHDSDGNRQEDDHPFTVLHFSLPPQVTARFAGVYCSPHKWSLGALQDRLAHDRKVELESIDFGKRYTLRVVDAQDDVALYELFSPPFIQRLCSEVECYWEQRGSDLVFWKKGHEKEAADLDRFCLESWHVLYRYLEEWR